MDRFAKGLGLDARREYRRLQRQFPDRNVVHDLWFNEIGETLDMLFRVADSIRSGGLTCEHEGKVKERPELTMLVEVVNDLRDLLGGVGVERYEEDPEEEKQRAIAWIRETYPPEKAERAIGLLWGEKEAESGPQEGPKLVE